MKILAIESSCDETAAAVVQEGVILSNVVATQMKVHAEYGGVVPELAAREHLSNVLPVVNQALSDAGMSAKNLDWIAATQGPGLPPALMVGYQAAQHMAFALGMPLLGVQHHEAHLYSPWIHPEEARLETEAFEPHISLVVSGGHTMLVWVRAPMDHGVVGATIDDAAGECFDKTAKMIGLPYPGGPVMDRLAAEGDPKAIDFPRPMLKDSGLDFSFSGLKTAVRYHLEKHPERLQSPDSLKDVCASVQAAITDVLVAKTLRAAQKHAVGMVTVSGGVACNRGLREALGQACEHQGLRLRVAQPIYCTDNAAMVGTLATWRIRLGATPTPREEGIRAGWMLDEKA